MLARLGFPEVGRHGRFVTAIGIDALGSGIFIPLSILYFLAATDLSLVRVGAALSLAALIALPAGPLIGSVVDRFGAKRVLLASNLLQAAGFLGYLVADSFAAVAAWTVLASVGATSFWGSYGAIVAAISRPGERERWFGFLGALRNLGFAVGGLVAGVVIGVGTAGAYAAVVLVNAVSYLVAFALLLAVPDATGAAAADRAPGAGGWGTVLRDGPYALLWLTQLGFSVTMLSLNFATPVYLTRVLGLPGWLTGAVFTLNCLMIGVAQGITVRAMTSRVRWRILVLAQAAFAASFFVLLAMRGLATPVAVAAGLLAGAVFTVGELTGGPVLSALAAEAAPEHLRGRYLSLIQFAWGVSGVLAPGGFGWLLDRGPTSTWLVMVAVAGVAALAAAALGRAMPLAGRRSPSRPGLRVRRSPPDPRVEY